MTIPTDVKVTTEILWFATLIFAPIDAIFVALLAWRLKSSTFRQLKWALTTSLGLLFFAIWGTIACYLFWESVYHYFFPAWARWLLPAVYGLLFAALGLLSWGLALHLPGNAVVNFCLLGGLWVMITHTFAIFRGLLEKPPMLQGASPVAVVVFPAFEFILYWCISLTASMLVKRSWERLKGSTHMKLP